MKTGIKKLKENKLKLGCYSKQLPSILSFQAYIRPRVMPYIVVRGNLGMANTKVYGLGEHEISEIKLKLRFAAYNENKDEVQVHNSVVFVLNQLEYLFGYRVITCTCQGDMAQPMWTLARPVMRA